MGHMISTFLRNAAGLGGLLAICACSGGSGSTPILPLTAISVVPSSLSLEVGESTPLTVVGTLSSGATVVLSSGLRFVAGNPAVAVVSASGVVTAVANGSASVTVSNVAPALSAAPVPITVAPGASRANTLALIVDEGPLGVVLANRIAVNMLYAAITLCSPGSTTACQVIDHVQVDTGSVGLQILSGALSGTATLAPETLGGAPLRRCVQYAGGYAWGSMMVADVRLGTRTVSGLPVHVIGDAAAGAAPASCSSGAGVEQTTSAQFAANGVLGVGNFLHDCGADCAAGPQTASYYACPASGCVSTAVPLAQQLTNPIGALTNDNNGAIVSLGPVVPTGSTNVGGTLYFGIDTQADNAVPAAATFLGVDPGTGTLTTVFGGRTLPNSVIDTGSPAYSFDDSSIAVCPSPDQAYYCPVTASGAATSLGLNALLQGTNGTTAAQSFTVANAQVLFGTGQILSAFSTLGGPNGGTFTGFAWGMPFFYGRSVYVLFEQQSAAGATGPAIGF